MNYSDFSVSSYGMWNRTAISGLLRLSIVVLLPVAIVPAMAGEPALKEACEPFVSPAAPLPDSTDEQTPFGEDVLWRLEKGDVTNHIFGTIHSQDRLVTNLPSRLRLILARSSRLLIELVPDAESYQTYADAIYSDRGPGLKEALPQSLYSRLQQIAGDYELPLERLNELEPWAAFSQIGRPRPVSGPTQDIVIYRTAISMGKPVIGLETMAELVDTLSSLPRDDQITILKDTICNHGRIIRESKTLLDLYLDGDLAGMVAFNKRPHYDEAVFERFMETVLEKRNQRMFERMLPYLEKGGSLVAVGALHLPDNKGLLQMLAQAGYSVSPVGNE